jgi:hypothetical protein
VGTNDHLPNKQQRTARRRRHEVREILVWNEASIIQLTPLITAISEAGGYIGLGRNSTGDALLIYVKLDDWKERIAVEQYGALPDTVSDLLEEVSA